MTHSKKLNCLLALLLASGTGVAIAQPSQGRCGGWFVEVEPFYVRAHDTLLTDYPYAVSFTEEFTGVGEDIGASTSREVTRFYHIDPEYQWGGRVAVGYDFASCDPCNYYGISLEYTHFDHDQDDSVHFPVDLTSSFPPTLRAVVTGTATLDDFFADARAKLDTQFDTVDLLARKTTTYCGGTTLRYFAGVRYLRLEEKLDVDYGPTTFIEFTNDVPPPTPLPESTITTVDRVHFKNEFNGAGPRIGANIFVPVGCSGFGITGQVAGNLLYGESHSNFDEVLVETEIDLPTVGTASHEGTEEVHHHEHDTDRFIPGLSGKVGIAYTATFCNCSSFTIEVGYRGDKYFGVSDANALVHSIGIGEELANGPYIGDNQGLNKDATFHDFEFSGPYLTLTYHM